MELKLASKEVRALPLTIFCIPGKMSIGRLSLVAQYDDLVRNSSVLTAGIEAGKNLEYDFCSDCEISPHHAGHSAPLQNQILSI